MTVQTARIDETACAILSLTTHLAWLEGMPQPMPRTVLHRMLKTGALSGLVLRDMPGIDEKWFERARLLLTRVNAVAERMEAYHSAGYELLLPSDARWPHALRVLGGNEPPFLYVKGNAALLNRRRLSVAGSRRILAETQLAARKTGAMIAADGAMLVTGGAAGVDTAALRGALEAGGCAAVVPAKPAARVMDSRAVCAALERGDLLLVCDSLPDEPFSAAKALCRNHTIYALGECSLVVAARDGMGGSWRGATDCLRGGFSPVYVWNGRNADTAGNRALEALGAGSYSLRAPLGAQLAERPVQTSLFEGG